MSFAEFEKAIVSEDLKSVARHWDEARGGKQMPSWRDLKPKRIAGQLPIVWSYSYDTASDAFTGRLAGDRITLIFGKNFRGLPMAEAYPKHDFPRLFARSKRVITEPAHYHGLGMVFRHLGRVGCGERIIMALGKSGVSEGIFGATSYPMEFSGHRPQVECENEVDSWFSY
jgi:hypothetical protein